MRRAALLSLACVLLPATAHAATFRVVPIGEPFPDDRTTGWAPLVPVALTVRDEVLLQTSTGPASIGGGAVWAAGAVRPLDGGGNAVYGVSDMTDAGVVIGSGKTAGGSGDPVALRWSSADAAAVALPAFQGGITELDSGVVVGVAEAVQPGDCDPEPRAYWGGTRADRSFDIDAWNHQGALVGTEIYPDDAHPEEPCAKKQRFAIWSGVGASPARLGIAPAAIAEDGLVVGRSQDGWAAEGPGAASFQRLPPGMASGGALDVGVDGFAVGYAEDAQGRSSAWGQKGGRWLDLAARYPLTGDLAGWTLRGAYLVNAKGDVVLRAGKGDQRRWLLGTVRYVISGTVVDRAGAPLAGVPVAVDPAAGTAPARAAARAATRTDRRGRFAIEVAGGPHRLVVAGVARAVAVGAANVKVARLGVDPPAAPASVPVATGGTLAVVAGKAVVPVACRRRTGRCTITTTVRRGKRAVGTATVVVRAGRAASARVPLAKATRRALARGPVAARLRLAVAGARPYRVTFAVRLVRS